MKKIFLYLFSIVLILNTQYVNASSSDAQKWLNEEISTIIELYRNNRLFCSNGENEQIWLGNTCIS